MISPAELEFTDDRLLGGRLCFRQPRQGYRVAIDPVLLAAAVPAGPGSRVLDAGTGTGAAALCLAARAPDCRVTGLERDADLLGLARRNVEANRMVDRVEVVAGDLLQPPDLVVARPFDLVMSNPPYHPHAAATAPATATAKSAHLATADLPTWLAACLARLKPGGSLVLIHPPDRLDTILGALAGRAGHAVVFPLWPRVDTPAAKRVIVVARKGARGPLRLARGLVLHEADGAYTAAALSILSDGAPLSVG
jgi:tRNA1(Val) A37 N6-methylase TrmN6